MISRGEIIGYRLGSRLIRVDLDEIDRVARVIPGARGSSVRQDGQEA